MHYGPCPTVRDCPAVDPALFSILRVNGFWRSVLVFYSFLIRTLSLFRPSRIKPKPLLILLWRAWFRAWARIQVFLRREDRWWFRCKSPTWKPWIHKTTCKGTIGGRKDEYVKLVHRVVWVGRDSRGGNSRKTNMQKLHHFLFPTLWTPSWRPSRIFAWRFAGSSPWTHRRSCRVLP